MEPYLSYDVPTLRINPNFAACARRTLPLRVSPRCAHVPPLSSSPEVQAGTSATIGRRRGHHRRHHASHTTPKPPKVQAGTSGRHKAKAAPHVLSHHFPKKQERIIKVTRRLLFAQLLVKVRQERVQILLRCIHCPPVLSASPGAELNQGGITVLKQQQKSPQEATSCERRGSTHRRSTQGVHFERCLFCHAAALLIFGDCEECGTSSALGTAPSGWQ
jgi:hypothetical protein